MSSTVFLRAIFTLLIVYAFVAGCAKPPTEDMIRAEKAIEGARQKEAGIYAKDLFSKTEESFSRAKELVSEKEYDEARKLALETEKLAEQAGTVAVVNREKERQRIEALHQETENLRSGILEALEGLKLLEKKDFKRRAAGKYKELQEKIPLWEGALANMIDTADEVGMLQTRGGLIKLREEIMDETQRMQSSLIKKKTQKD